MKHFLSIILVTLVAGAANAQDEQSYNVCERFPEFCIPGDQVTRPLARRQIEFNVCEVWPESCDVKGNDGLSKEPRTLDFCQLYPDSCVIQDREGLKAYFDQMIQGGF
ncbi:hypothetical protein P775_07965 [Puniceibacterium antarcticum]|uniref:Uncharacterized protein n=1 Tax=Puniceibacterium antarcticum TaxID=1206336 RepID=A0A2G8RGV9_9RHOB|nr:hypothetical protein [Puniceibacterium antarcticum]PIL20752.1 hypothetical protein P775_07965 [Puniceibacterium antarcticum]